jgi:hypothetical protein
MYAIKLTAIVPDDRRLVIELPPDAPTGEVEIEIHAAPQSAEPEPQAETPKRARSCWRRARCQSSSPICRTIMCR